MVWVNVETMVTTTTLLTRLEGLTINRQSIMARNSRSRLLSSVTEMPPTLAYKLFGQNASQRPLLDTVIEVITKRWHVKDERVNKGRLAQI